MPMNAPFSAGPDPSSVGRRGQKTEYSPQGELPGTADAVVVGGGTVGAWCAYFLRQAGLRTVVLL
ncbi:MAG: hypothetical protein ACRDP7_40845, partial [Trebonia sp.]